jgi:hypothetical protein
MSPYDSSELSFNSKQRGRAMALVIMGHGSGTALLHRQAGLSAIERLDLRLLSMDSTTAWAGGET